MFTPLICICRVGGGGGELYFIGGVGAVGVVVFMIAFD